MLLNIGIGFMVFGVLAFILAVICFGFLVLLDKDVLDSKVDKIFGVSIISWAFGTLFMVLRLIIHYSGV